MYCVSFWTYPNYKMQKTGRPLQAGTGQASRFSRRSRMAAMKRAEPTGVKVAGTEGTLRKRGDAGEQHEGCGNKGNDLFHIH